MKLDRRPVKTCVVALLAMVVTYFAAPIVIFDFSEKGWCDDEDNYEGKQVYASSWAGERF